MYKVFINEKVICFTNNTEKTKDFSNVLVLNFFLTSNIPFLLELLDNGRDIDAIIINVPDFDNAFKSFQSYFKIINAAGGIVVNNQNKKLFIYRLHKWDLPKGKIEADESIENAAIREVEEECGITGLTINNKLTDTFHVYEHKEKLILKQTFWFGMTTDFTGELTPQLEENITKVKWLTDLEIEEIVLKNTYSSIRELLAITF